MKKPTNPVDQFHSEHYLRHNAKRLEHLDSLAIDFKGKNILEVGAGIGDHTEHLLAKECSYILATEAREANLRVLRARFENEPRVRVEPLDIENPRPINREFDVVYCYGLLYHLSRPDKALEFLSTHTTELLLLETCVSYSKRGGFINLNEDADSYTQSISGKGCKPSREWVFNSLGRYFRFVYMPITQPDHEQFPTDWTQTQHHARLSRAVFIAARVHLKNPALISDIPMRQANVKFYARPCGPQVQ